MNGNRVGWVDVFRGLAIVLVVYGHCGRGLERAGLVTHFEGSPIDDWIYSFHMPAFFFAAGLFAARSLARGRGQFFINKLRTVAYPYVLWSAIYILALRYLPMGNTKYESNMWGRIAYEPLAVYWFLYVLFIVQIVYLLIRGIKYGPLVFYCLCVIAWCLESAGALESVMPHDPFWAWHSVMKYAVYFAAGDAVMLLTDPEAPPPRDSAIFALIFFAGMTLLLAFGHHPKQGWWDLPLAMAGIQGLWELSVVLDRRGSSWLAFLGRHSLEIYVAHIFATAAMRWLLVKANVADMNVHLLLGTLAGIVGPVILVWLCNRIGFRYLFTFGRQK